MAIALAIAIAIEGKIAEMDKNWQYMDQVKGLQCGITQGLVFAYMSRPNFIEALNLHSRHIVRLNACSSQSLKRLDYYDLLDKTIQLHDHLYSNDFSHLKKLSLTGQLKI